MSSQVTRHSNGTLTVEGRAIDLTNDHDWSRANGHTVAIRDMSWFHRRAAAAILARNATAIFDVTDPIDAADLLAATPLYRGLVGNNPLAELRGMLDNPTEWVTDDGELLTVADMTAQQAVDALGVLLVNAPNLRHVKRKFETTPDWYTDLNGWVLDTPLGAALVARTRAVNKAR